MAFPFVKTGVTLDNADLRGAILTGASLLVTSLTDGNVHTP